MVAVPAATPVTTPVVLTAAVPGALLLHVPPTTELPNARVAPTQTVVPPVILPGAASSVNGKVATQPAVYDIVTVPATRPVTTPDVLTVATVGLLLLHVPPLDAMLNGVLEPTHTDVAPDMVPAPEDIVTVVVASVPHPVE